MISARQSHAWLVSGPKLTFMPLIVLVRPHFSLLIRPQRLSQANCILATAILNTQADTIARYHRMRGERVFYPMGFDDNGLPTERFVEKTIKRKASEMGRDAFIAVCLELTQQTEARFETLWRRLGLSVDWGYRYSTISPEARRVAQWSFIRLQQQGLTYTQQAPTLWCPECQTAIAQAEVNDVVLPTQFTTLAFCLPNGVILPIATRRPKLLTASFAIVVHP